MSEMKAELKAMYNRMNTIEKIEDDTALQANQGSWKGKKQFKGRCRNCGIYGHKGTDCRHRHNMSNEDKNMSTGFQNKNQTRKFNGTCHYCGKYGHRKSECYQLKNRTGNGNNAGSANVAEQKEQEFALTTCETGLYIWIGDSGSSCHMTYNVEGLHDLRTVVPEESITVGDGNQLRVTHIGKLRASIEQDDGSKKTIVLHDVKVVPK